jgi:circadian clock protein KaiB
MTVCTNHLPTKPRPTPKTLSCGWIWASPLFRETEMTEATQEQTEEQYILRLYVAGMTSRSARAVENVRAFCEKHLEGRYDLQVIDVYQQPALARTEQLVAAPTLIKKLPLPLRRLIGDMSDEGRVLVGLDLVPRN